MTLKEFRDAIGISQSKLANELGFSTSQYKKVEEGISKGSLQFWRSVHSYATKFGIKLSGGAR